MPYRSIEQYIDQSKGLDMGSKDIKTDTVRDIDVTDDSNSVAEGNSGILWSSGAPMINGEPFSAYLESMLIEAGVESMTLTRGETIFSESNKGDCAYFVGKGKVEISCLAPP